MTQHAARAATYEDLLALPDNVVGEILAGELVVSPRPAPPHALASSSLAGDLHGPYGRGRGGPGGWWILFEPELHLGPHVLVPDLAGWRKQRMPQMPDTAWFATAPDWVAEVISPSTGIIDRTLKLDIYGQQGVAWLWFVEPRQRTVEVYRNVDGSWIVERNVGGSSSVALPPFLEAQVDLWALWGEPEPPE